jgi:hypothetical protein
VKRAPSEANLQKLENKSFSTGSMLDAKCNNKFLFIAAMISRTS